MPSVSRRSSPLRRSFTVLTAIRVAVAKDPVHGIHRRPTCNRECTDRVRTGRSGHRTTHFDGKALSGVTWGV